MARGSKIKKITGKRGVSYRTTVDVGTDPATGKRKQKVLTAKTKQELEKLVAQTLADVSRSVYFEPQKMTMSEYLDYWLKNYAKMSVESTTYDKLQTIINIHLKPAFGAIPISKLTPAHVQGFITSQLESGNKRKEGGLAPKTVADHYTLLRETLAHAVKWEIIPRNVADAVDRPKVPRKEAEPLSAEQTDTIINALSGTYFRKITEIGAHTGMREAEILALKWEDIKGVNFKDQSAKSDEEAWLLVTHSLRQFKGTVEEGPTKNKRIRQIDLMPDAVAVLKARHKEYAAEKLAAGDAYNDQGYVFAKANGSPRRPRTFSGSWVRAVLRRTGIKAHFHQCRHTAATLMLEAGVPLKAVSEMLGHSSVKITGDVYGHVTPTGRREAARKLAEALVKGRK